MKGRNIATIVGLIILIAVVNLVMTSLIRPAGAGAVSGGASVYSRVIKSGELRCAYLVDPPCCIKDPNTGKLTGICVEALVEAAKNLGLKVRWTEEVGWGSMIEGLQADRYDLVCSGIWPNSTRARLVDFSTPLFFSSIGVYVRPDVNQFTRNLAAINDSSVKIATIDGETSDIIARSQFPNAQRISLPQLSDLSQMLLYVTQRKADVTFVEPYIAYQFLKNNPGSIKDIAADKPIRVFGNTLMFRRGQFEFKTMLNIAFDELVNSGFVDKLVDHYEPFPGAFYRVRYPYRLPGAKGMATQAAVSDVRRPRGV